MFCVRRDDPNAVPPWQTNRVGTANAWTDTFRSPWSITGSYRPLFQLLLTSVSGGVSARHEIRV